MPIPTELALVLDEYVQNLHSDRRVFWFPSRWHHNLATLRHDLDGASVTTQWETGEIADFHTVRTTAIGWWLDEYNLSPKWVQILARLKTLALMEGYSRKLRLSDDFSWLDKGPRLSESDEDDSMLGQLFGHLFGRYTHGLARQIRQIRQIRQNGLCGPTPKTAINGCKRGF